MPQYDVYVLCNECGSVHPMGIGVFLDVAPFDDQSIEEIYERNLLPPQLQAIEGHKALCLKAGSVSYKMTLRKYF